jgi:hypothetical protein
MATEARSVTTTVPVPADVVSAVRADSAGRAAIDGTGWVCEPLDDERLTKSGHVFCIGGGEFVGIDVPRHLGFNWTCDDWPDEPQLIDVTSTERTESRPSCSPDGHRGAVA